MKIDYVKCPKCSKEIATAGDLKLYGSCLDCAYEGADFSGPPAEDDEEGNGEEELRKAALSNGRP